MSNKNSDWKSNDYKETFKPNLKIAKILELKRTHKDMHYCQLRVDKSFDPYKEGLDTKLQEGYSIVYEDCGVVDDRASTKSSETDNNKSTPIVENGKGGAQFIWLSIPKEEFRKLQKDRLAKDKSKMLSSQKGRRVDKKGNNLKITDPEVSINQLNDD